MKTIGLSKFGAAALVSITFMATPALAGTAVPTVTILGNFGTVLKAYPTGGVIADPASPVAGAVIGGVAYGPTQPGAVVMFTPPVSGAAWTGSIVHAFTGPDGSWPQGRLLPKGGALLGTAFYGGASGNGTLFQLTPNGAGYSFTKLMDFGTSACAAIKPHGSLVFGFGGAIYGNAGVDTTGGTGQGSIFELVPPATVGAGWTCAVIEQFIGGTDGKSPQGLSVAADGSLFYTLLAGGVDGYGRAEHLAPASTDPLGPWTRTTLHDFRRTGNDGHYPLSSLLIDAGGAVYGFTASGGSAKQGTFYTFSPPAVAGGAWGYSILHNFTGGASDAVKPRGPMVMTAAGDVYGSSFGGGTAGLGTVFKLSPGASAWSSTVLRSFSGGLADAQEGSGGLYAVSDHLLFGTTRYGGALNTGVLYNVTLP